MTGRNKKEALGKKIQALRKQAKLRQEAVAERIGIDAKSLSRIECGAHYPSLETLEAIGNVLNIPMKEFFDLPDMAETDEQRRDYITSTARSIEGEKLRQLTLLIKEFMR